MDTPKRPRRFFQRAHPGRWVLILAFLCLGFTLACFLPAHQGETVYRPRTSDLLALLPQATVQAGSPEEGRVAVQPQFPVGGVARPALYAHPPAEVSYAHLPLHEGGRLEFGLGIHEAAWKGPGDGVRFEVVLHDEDGREHVLFSQEVDPVHQEEDRRWIDVSLDLSAYANQVVSITFRTAQRENPLNDWAAWSAPRLSSEEPLLVGAEDHANVLLVTVDTVRADHLSGYGYERDTSPALDRLAQEGVLFEQAYCQAALTTPSHASILSSLYPRTHQLYDNGFLSPEVRTLPTLLQSQGYDTAAVVGVKFLLPQFSGLGQGFDTFFPFPEEEESPRAERSAEEVTDLAAQWLEQHYRDPCFLWVHYYDPHWPYQPPAPYDGRFYQGDPYDPDNHSMDEVPPGRRRIVGDVTDMAHPIAQYDGEIAYTDTQLGRLFDLLDTLALSDNTLVVVVADHGESLTEHNVYFEHWALYDETIHVPLVMRYPGHLPAGRRIPGLVEAGVDIVPTVLDLLGLAPLEEAEGRSLVPLIRGAGSSADRVFCEQRNALAVATRSERYKFILHRATNRELFPWHPMVEGKRELYDLRRDPGEEENLVPSSAQEERARQLASLCRTWLERAGIAIEPAEGERQEDLEDILKELGY